MGYIASLARIIQLINKVFTLFVVFCGHIVTIQYVNNSAYQNYALRYCGVSTKV